MFGLSKTEEGIFKKFNTPQKIQDFLDTIPQNLRKNGSSYGDSCSSPRYVLKRNKAHCIEGALLGAAILWYHGKRPLLVDLKASVYDYDHVIAVFQEGRHWGALSKTNHPVLQYRDPVYRSIRELVMSYFHEYYNEDGTKTLRSFTQKPFDLSSLDKEWITTRKGLWHISRALDRHPHTKIFHKKLPRLRPPGMFVQRAGELREWSSTGRRKKVK